MASMTHWERIQAALQGEEVDHVPVSLWRHWPVADETPQGLADAMVHWQQEYDFDLLKFMPTGMYGVHDWGVETVYNPGHRGNRIATKTVIDEPEDWTRLAKLDVNEGYYGAEVEAIRLAAAELNNSVPILQTVFSPLTTAAKLAGDRVYADMRLHPKALHAALQQITETTIDFTLACLRGGAHGVFYASQNASYRLLNAAEFGEFGAAYDLQVLQAIENESQFNMMHIHGEDIMFNVIAAQYPINLVNWHDRVTSPSLQEAQEKFNGLLVGGIDDRKTISDGPVDTIRWQVTNAIEQTGGKRLVIGPGCVIPTNTPDSHVRAVIETVRGTARA
jgi:uroporphyrinogen decarboxylase